MYHGKRMLQITRVRMLRASGARLARARSGVAAIEFALIAPILILMATGLHDLTRAFIAWQRLSMAAQAIAEIATSVAATAANTNSLNASQAGQASSAVYAYLPNTATPTHPAFGVTLTSIVMTPTVQGCVAACTYTAHVAWSGVFQGTSPRRLCDAIANESALTAVSDDLDPSPSTLPTHVYSAAPLLVADVSYTYTPLFLQFITGPIAIVRTAYFSTRTGRVGNWIRYVEPGGDSLRCAGYSG
jgi:Flp pilus assembly protein TadG